jgi:hypothetical protein
MTGEVKIISRTYRKIKGKYYARVRYQIDDGKPLDILRQVENKSGIKRKQAEIEVELRKNGPAQLVAGKVTFRQLAQYAKNNIYVAAVYDDQETRITGVRSVVPAHACLNNLVAFFGDIDIGKINEKKLTDYQVARLTGTIKNRSKVSLSTVDRELSKARRLFNIAVDEGWLLRSPFTKAVSRNLIHDAAETPDPIKTRELTDEEALRVMKALDTPERLTLYQCSLRQWILEPESPACWITFAGKTLTLVTRSSRSLPTKAKVGTSSQSAGRCR